MRSSTDTYFIALDHVRALAVFTVFAWHFVHVNGLHVTEVAWPPLAIFSEGHTGVAIFMTLSGYLFARLLQGRRINYPQFLWNRFLRLAPLLALVLAIIGLRRHLAGDDITAYVAGLASGLLKPTLPNGGWSITVEFHFYLLLPLLLLCARRSALALPAMILAAIAVRFVLYAEQGSVQWLSYTTLIGRIDQFLLGILACQYRHLVQGRHGLAVMTAIGFAVFMYLFESRGGFIMGGYPSPSALWIVMTTIEGGVYALLIAWYDSSFRHGEGVISRFVALVGACSYSMYLLHFFFYERLGDFIDSRIIALDNIYLALAASVPAFLLLLPLAWLSFQLVERPFLRYRRGYLRAAPGAESA